MSFSHLAYPCAHFCEPLFSTRVHLTCPVYIAETKQEFNGGVEMELGAMQLLLFENDLMLGQLESLQLPK